MVKANLREKIEKIERGELILREYPTEKKTKLHKSKIVKFTDGKKPIKIPERFKNFNFVLIDENSHGKKPKGKAWQKKDISFADSGLQEHIKKDFNYGVRAGKTSPINIDGKTYFLIVVDFDKREFQDKIKPLLPKTFTTTSGSEKNCEHLWFACDDDKSFKIKDENKNVLCDMIGEGGQVVGVGSKHSSGSIYKIVNDIDFAFIPYSELEAILKPHDKSPKKPLKQKALPKIKLIKGDVAEKMINSVSMETILKEFGVDTSKNPTNCPLRHSSRGGKCFSWNDEVCHCFHCQNEHEGWNKFSLVREVKNLTDKETFDWFAEKSGMNEELKKDKEKFVGEQKEIKTDSLTPYFFDSNRIWWIWDERESFWQMCDEIDVLNMCSQKIGSDVISPKQRQELLNYLKQEGRRKKPKECPKHWLQFKDTIVDLRSGGQFKASPEYFNTNPIPYKLGKSEDTPTIDKLFGEWVIYEEVQDKSWVQTLYEILAYACCKEQFLQTIIALTGAGSNGKGTYQNLIGKFLGEKNICSSNLKALSVRNFEASALYKKLVCFFGEVDSNDLTNTNLIKSLTGEDLIRYEFKGKTPFSEYSGTTPIIATNSLPITPDKSIGFYRRWLIVDFLNQFKIRRDLLAEVPEWEYENLGRKVISVLKKLYEQQEFTNCGTIEERISRYESRSHPLNIFISECCSEGDGMIKLRDFSERFNKFLREKRLRIYTINKISKMLRDEGFEVGARHFGKGNTDSAKAVINLTFNNEKLSEKSQKKLNENAGIGQSIAETGSFSSLDNEKLPKLPIQPTPRPILINSSEKKCIICGSPDAFIIEKDKLYCEECLPR